MSIASLLLPRAAAAELRKEGVMVDLSKVKRDGNGYAPPNTPNNKKEDEVVREGCVAASSSSSTQHSSSTSREGAERRLWERVGLMEAALQQHTLGGGSPLDFFLGKIPLEEWTIGDVCLLIAENAVGGVSTRAKDARQLVKYIDIFANTPLRDERAVLSERHLQSRVLEVRDAMVASYKAPSDQPEEGCEFTAFGDWGMVAHWEVLSSTLSTALARSEFNPKFILAVGDNIYPQGVPSIESPVLAAWRETFVLGPKDGKKANPALAIPWYLILGNHDYRNPPKIAPVSRPVFPSPPPYTVRNCTYLPNTEVDFSYSPIHNPEFMWRLPGSNYTFSRSIPGRNGKMLTVDFFGIDTCGVQQAVRRADPDSYTRLKQQVGRLEHELKASKAKWKIVFGHHPLYTVGYGHQDEARCLRGEKCVNVMDAMNTTVHSHGATSLEGIGLEGALIRGGAHLYIAGHDHASQYTCTRYTAPATAGGKPASGGILHHVICGAPVNPGYYGGALFSTHSKIVIDKADGSNEDVNRCNNAMCTTCSLPPPRDLSGEDPFRSQGRQYQHCVEWDNSATVAIVNVAVVESVISIQFTSKSGYVLKSINICDHLTPAA